MTEICSIPSKSNRRNKAARALESVLRTFADPVAKRLKVRTGLRGGGIDVQNHNRRLLAAS